MTPGHAPARMRAPRRRAGLLLGLAGLVACASHADSTPLATALREMEGTPGLSVTATVQLLHIGYNVAPRGRVTERLLGDTATTRCRMQYTPALGADFLFSLGTATPQPAAQEADLRWAVEFLDRHGVPLHRLAINGRSLLDGAGRLGYVDGIAVALQPGMAEWFERTLAVCQSRHEE